jgi:hypothetical protein
MGSGRDLWVVIADFAVPDASSRPLVTRNVFEGKDISAKFALEDWYRQQEAPSIAWEIQPSSLHTPTAVFRFLSGFGNNLGHSPRML